MGTDRTNNTRKVIMVLSFYLFTFLQLGAQTTFTQRIQTDGKGGATLTITHDKTIDSLVNGPTATQPAPKQPVRQPEQTTATNQKKEEKRPEQHVVAARDTVNTESIDARRKVMKGGYRVNGYRVQAFAGGNSRKDRQLAEQTRDKIKTRYPSEPIYVHFYSPRWICRVGNYRTYEEAHQMLLNIRKLGIQGASIVKGKITVPYLPPTNQE